MHSNLQLPRQPSGVNLLGTVVCIHARLRLGKSTLKPNLLLQYVEIDARCYRARFHLGKFVKLFVGVVRFVALVSLICVPCLTAQQTWQRSFASIANTRVCIAPVPCNVAHLMHVREGITNISSIFTIIMRWRKSLLGRFSRLCLRRAVATHVGTLTYIEWFSNVFRLWRIRLLGRGSWLTTHWKIKSNFNNDTMGGVAIVLNQCFPN